MEGQGPRIGSFRGGHVCGQPAVGWLKRIKHKEYWRREIPYGSSEEYWAMNESLTQLMKNY